jgi:hypothetical protein
MLLFFMNLISEREQQKKELERQKEALGEIFGAIYTKNKARQIDEIRKGFEDIGWARTE